MNQLLDECGHALGAVTRRVWRMPYGDPEHPLALGAHRGPDSQTVRSTLAVTRVFRIPRMLPRERTLDPIRTYLR